jgi:hypothetical protein
MTSGRSAGIIPRVERAKIMDRGISRLTLATLRMTESETDAGPACGPRLLFAWTTPI